jgi:hypothetical protein
MLTIADDRENRTFVEKRENQVGSAERMFPGREMLQIRICNDDC